MIDFNQIRQDLRLTSLCIGHSKNFAKCERSFEPSSVEYLTKLEESFLVVRSLVSLSAFQSISSRRREPSKQSLLSTSTLSRKGHKFASFFFLLIHVECSMLEQFPINKILSKSNGYSPYVRVSMSKILTQAALKGCPWVLRVAINAHCLLLVYNFIALLLGIISKIGSQTIVLSDAFCSRRQFKKQQH